MLTEEQIAQNKEDFLKLLSEIDIEEADVAGLVEYLDNSDFFIAPASTMYHNAYPGGLCEHSLHVYHELVRLHDLYKDKFTPYDKNSLLIVGLLHDLSKTNYYEKYIMNKKIYNPKGLKKDSLGNFDWFPEEAYKIKDAKDRFLAGTHEMNSVFLVGKYIPLSFEENLAIMHHQPIPAEGEPIRDMSAILNRYPLITLLQMADYLSTFILERI